MLGCYLDPKNDYAFRRIFGDEKREHVLRRFLNSILRLKGERQIKHLRIADPHQLPAIDGWKENILDVRCWDQQERHFLVEMQVWDQKDFQHRALYAAAKAYGENRNAAALKSCSAAFGGSNGRGLAPEPCLPSSGQGYRHLRKVTLLSILGFQFLETSSYLANHLILDAQTGEHRLQDVDFTFLELPKFRKSEEELETIEDKWAFFLKNAHKTPLHDVPVTLQEPEIEEAFAVLERIGQDATAKQLYDAAHMLRMDHISQIETGYDKGLEKGRRQGLEQGLEQGVKQGLEQGVKQGLEQGVKQGLERGVKQGLEQGRKVEKQQIARQMLAAGMDVERIVQMTGLTAAEIKRLDEKSGGVC